VNRPVSPRRDILRDWTRTSTINRPLFKQQTLVHIWIVNAMGNVKRTITAIMHQNAPGKMIMRDAQLIEKLFLGW